MRQIGLPIPRLKTDITEMAASATTMVADDPGGDSHTWPDGDACRNF